MNSTSRNLNARTYVSLQHITFSRVQTPVQTRPDRKRKEGAGSKMTSFKKRQIRSRLTTSKILYQVPTLLLYNGLQEIIFATTFRSIMSFLVCAHMLCDSRLGSYSTLETNSNTLYRIVRTERHFSAMLRVLNPKRSIHTQTH